MSSPLLTPSMVSDRLTVSQATLCIWRGKRVGPKWFTRGQFVYYREDDFAEYLDELGPIPPVGDRRRFFADAHRGMIIPETPEPATLEVLEDRLTVVEAELATLRENSPEALQERLRKAESKLAAKIRRNQKRKPLVPALPS